MTDAHKPAQDGPGAPGGPGSGGGIPGLTGQDPSHRPREGAGPARRRWPHSIKRADHRGGRAGMRSGSGPTGPQQGRAGDWHPMVSLGRDGQPQTAGGSHQTHGQDVGRV